MLYLIDCDIVYLCFHGSSSYCIELIVALFNCAHIGLPHVAVYWLWQCYLHSFVFSFFALDWLWHCLSVFLWFVLLLHWFDSDIVCLCSCGSSSCCIGLILTLLICVLVAHPYVVFDWLWYCLSVFSWFFLMLHWIDCGIVYLCSNWSFSCCIVLIVTLFIWVLTVLPHVALDWLWHCLSVFLWFFLMLHWIDSDIVCLCSCGSSSCCIGFNVTLFVFVLMVLPHVALDWMWYFFLCSYGSTSSCIELIVVLFICVFIFLPHVALDWSWHC